MTVLPKLNTGEQADICLILEGTYPYIRGGVSSWVHQIINGFPEYQFALLFIGASREHYTKMSYELPDNVCHLEMYYLTDDGGSKQSHSKPDARKGDTDAYKVVAHFHRLIQQSHSTPTQAELNDFIQLIHAKDKLTVDDFLYSESSWNFITDQYQQHCPDASFKDYFWTIRAMHKPLFNLFNIARNAPKARCYHTISTGYAGLTGMLLRYMWHKPLMLTEHGIYTKERRIDLYQVEWIKEVEPYILTGLAENMSYLRHLWISFFEVLGRLTYSAADPIITLYEANRTKQIEYGADPQRSYVIPNGIRLERFIPLRDKRPDHVPPILGLIGRVVPIKDIKTYIRAISSICQKIPEAEGWIIGPEDEDEKYADECHALVASLGMQEKVKFLGFQNIDDILPQLGLMTLSSISEGQPLVILEGYAAGLPTLATDVGSCRELVEGRPGEDAALGSAGAIVPIANPAEMAVAAVALLSDEKRWYAAQAASIARVEKYYTEEKFLDDYRHAYKDILANAS
jgi:glycosyltransferase involved in cell wall biosynthesis